jgi:hypothetical protein
MNVRKRGSSDAVPLIGNNFAEWFDPCVGAPFRQLVAVNFSE